MIELNEMAPDSVPDIYFTREYGALDATFRGGTWRVLADSTGDWQLPLVIIDSPGVREALSPYGYAGIYVSDECSSTQSIQNWRSAQHLLADFGVVSVFLRFSPMDLRSSAAADALPGLTMVRSGETYLKSISDPEAMWTSMEGRARTAVRKALSEGMQAQVRRAMPTDLAGEGPFRALYDKTMRRVEANEQYFFHDDYFRALATIPSSPLYLVEVTHHDDVVAASLIMRHAERAHYHLSGSDPAAARRGANALLVWTMLEWCAENDIAQCHLGGGVRADDGLSKFKRSFGGDVVDFYTGRSIINHEQYDRLTTERARAIGSTTQSLRSSGFFPAFRAGA